MKRGTPDHPKVDGLMNALSIARCFAVGILESLWHMTMRYAPTGDIGKFTDKQIAHKLGWDGDPQELIKALVVNGWLVENRKHRLIVHDWHDHADQSTKRYLAKHNLVFASLKLASTSNTRARATTRARASANTITPDGVDSSREAPEENPKAVEVYEHYLAMVPRTRSPVRGQSVKNIAKRLEYGFSPDDLMKAADNYAEEIRLTEQEKYFYIVSNFYGRAAYYEAFLPGKWKPPPAKATSRHGPSHELPADVSFEGLSK